MTKAELKKEAIQYAVDYPTSYGKGYKHKDLRIAYLAGAEPREKRITELEEINADLKQSLDWADERESEDVKLIEELEKENAELKKLPESDKKSLLEAQIEKLKCCENCAFFKEKKYGICHNIKKLGKRKCAFYEMF